MDSNPCAGEQRERCYLSGQVLDSHSDVNPAHTNCYNVHQYCDLKVKYRLSLCCIIAYAVVMLKIFIER